MAAMKLIDLWKKVDEKAKENLVSLKTLDFSPKALKKAFEVAEEAVAREYPENWNNWLARKDFPFEESRFARILKYFGLHIYPRQANKGKIIEAYYACEADSLFGSYMGFVKPKFNNFTLHELYLHRRCCIAHELGVGPRAIL